MVGNLFQSDKKNEENNNLDAPVIKSAADYKISISNPFLSSDDDVNQKLFELGFTNQQAQAVYDLAAEKVLPVIEELARDFEAERQRQILIEHFGSKERFCEVSRQITAWAKQNLSENIFEALATTYEGVMTLYKMMENGEPAVLKTANSSADILSEEDLKKLMMSPKYWKEQDPATLKKVSDGFKRLYPSAAGAF